MVFYILYIKKYFDNFSIFTKYKYQINIFYIFIQFIKVINKIFFLVLVKNKIFDNLKSIKIINNIKIKKFVIFKLKYKYLIL